MSLRKSAAPSLAMPAPQHAIPIVCQCHTCCHLLQVPVTGLRFAEQNITTCVRTIRRPARTSGCYVRCMCTAESRRAV